MSKEEESAIWTVPTEMNRANGFIDLSALIVSAQALGWLALRGAPVWMFVPPLALLAIFVLTGEPASDIPFVGALAAVLRSKLGMRRAHEWVMAYAHYFAIHVWLNWKRAWKNSRLRVRLYICSSRLRAMLFALLPSRLHRSFTRSS